MMQILPEVDSPIVHSMGSDEHNGGLQSTIYLQNQNMLLDDNQLEFSDNEPTAYLTTSPVAQLFRPFQDSKDIALRMTLGIYLSLLGFVKDNWNDIEKSMDKKIKLIKKVSFPKKCDKNITFLSHGSVVYQRWFDVLFLHYKKSSLDEPQCTNFVHLQINNVSIQVEPTVLYNMSLQFDQFMEILTRVGYKYPGPVGINIQL
jgi:hypothetical protein